MKEEAGIREQKKAEFPVVKVELALEAGVGLGGSFKLDGATDSSAECTRRK